MDYSQPFSVLNERLRPRVTSSNQLHSSLSRLEDRQMGSLRSRFTSYRTTVLPPEPEPEPEPEEPEQEDLDCDSLGEGSCADLLPGSNSILITQLNLNEEELAEEDNVSTHSEEKDTPGDLSTEGSRDSPVTIRLTAEDGSQSFINGTIPDLLKSGRPLSRRRTLGHVSETLNEVRREVELSRRRSIKLKAQVDKLQESRDGPGWSQHRERVTEEVLSILRLLHPLTEPEPCTPEPLTGENRLDSALAQLQRVARKLAISHTKQSKEVKRGQGAEDSAVLQQALRDRDEAIEKKKAMEDELLRSKTDMMMLNNQLLEAVQKRLEMSLELEAWKEDFQLILQQQVKAQQEAEQAQKKPSRMGLLRRNNKPLQRPSTFPLPAPTPPTTNSNQIFMPRATVCATPTPSTPPSAQRNWRDKLKRGRISRPGEDAMGRESQFHMDDGFHVVSLD